MRCPIVFQGHASNCKITRLKIIDFDPNWKLLDCNSSLNSPMATKWCTKLEVASNRYPIVFQGHTSNCKVTRLKKSSILTQIGRFWTVAPVWIHWWIWNDAQSLMSYRRGALLFFGVIHQISRSHGLKNRRLNPIWIRLVGRSQLSNPSDLPCSWYLGLMGGPTQFNTLKPRQNGCHLPDAIFKYILLNQNVWISIKISLKFVPKGPVNNIPALIEIMAWRRPGDKSLSEAMLTRFTDAYMRH